MNIAFWDRNNFILGSTLTFIDDANQSCTVKINRGFLKSEIEDVSTYLYTWAAPVDELHISGISESDLGFFSHMFNECRTAQYANRDPFKLVVYHG